MSTSINDDLMSGGKLQAALFSTDASGNTVLVGADGETYKITGNPIIKTGSWTGTGAALAVDLGFEPDLVIVKGDGKNAVYLAKSNWYGNIQAFGNVAVSGSDGTPPPIIRSNGLYIVTSTADGLATLNDTGATYYYVAIKDNGSGILKTWAYNGYRDVPTTDPQGTASTAVDMDLIVGTSPEIVHIKRDATGATHEGVWLTADFAKKESATAVDNTLATLESDGTIALSNNVAVNENDSGILGEGTHGISFHKSGQYWSKQDYIGTGAEMYLQCEGNVAAAFVIPQAAAAMTMWIDGMGVNAGDGGATALASGKIYGDGTRVVVGTDVAVNTASTTYTLLTLHKSDVPVAEAFPVTRRPGVRLTANGSAYVNCGTNDSLAIAGAHSLEWIGSISAATDEQFIIGRMNGGRATPAAGSYNYAMAFKRDPEAGLEICTSDRFSSEAGSDTKQKRWRTGIILRPFENYHVLYTHDGVDKWVLYINGVAVKWRRLSMVDVFALPGITATTGLSMAFGARLAAGSWYAAASGVIHRFGRLYNRALTASEASSAFRRNFLGESVSDIDASALVEEWAFSNGTGSTVSATKNTANNGTMINAAWVK